MNSIMFHLLLIVLVSTVQIKSENIYLGVDTSGIINTVNERYVGVTIDAGLIRDRWGKLDIRSVKLQNLVKGLKNSLLRIGGTAADFLIFTEKNETSPSLNDDVVRSRGKSSAMQSSSTFYMYASDWDKINFLLKLTGWPLYFGLNLRLRNGNNWNPDNAINLLNYTINRGYQKINNLNFELGNEPTSWDKKELLTPEQIGTDFKSLNALLKSQQFHGSFSSSKLAGPDPNWAKRDFLHRFLKVIGTDLGSLTAHQYYFNGKTAKLKDYIDVNHFNSLNGYIDEFAKSRVNTKAPNVPLWIGETATGYDSGTPGISDRYVASFLWMDKLGLGAKRGLKTVIRQALYGGFYCVLNETMDPTPDYWMTLLYTKLVGSKVLQTKLSNDLDGKARFYTHCCRSSENGCLVTYGMNLSPNTTINLKFDAKTFGDKLYIYKFSPGDKNGLLSKLVSMNGEVLSLIKGFKLPEIIPVKLSTSSRVQLDPLTYIFVKSTSILSLCS